MTTWPRWLRIEAMPALTARTWGVALIAALLMTLGSSASRAADAGLSRGLNGTEQIYTVAKNDSLTSIGARFGIEVARLAADNDLTSRSRLVTGQLLRIDSRHLEAPGLPDWGIVVNIPQRLLFYADSGSPVLVFPVAVGRPDWKTPTGEFQIVTRERHPVWVVPASIQAEMRRLGTPVLRRVEPGPDNPLGDFWMGLSASGCGIHATNAPASIYGFRTHGCIRLHPDDAKLLFERVVVGTPVRVVYEPLLVAKTGEGAIWLEVYRDRYRMSPEPVATLRALAARAGIETEIDWTLAGSVIAEEAGTPRRIDRGAAWNVPPSEKTP